MRLGGTGAIVISLTHQILWGWLVVAGSLAALFGLIIFIRITTPRFRVETLARLGWATLLVQLLGLFLVYGLGLLLA